ncbi:HAD-like protein [Artomyces pyxidatus]|uniref:HAD-like protein n=1 Tax=Artomyces pyxidatus TaxID=48021 RepID=A0ACB8T8J7_9AGAM|nr:HAD-like protein [Artomyces pyxidatus]
MLCSPIWFDYECGRISEDDCYRLTGDVFAVDARDVRQAIAEARKSLTPDNTFFGFIKELQEESGGRLRIIAMSNISAPDYECIRKHPVDWSLFQRVFTSAEAGMRKPSLQFYRYVLETIAVDPSTVVFVDDRLENVTSARSLGINGIVFNDPAKVRQALYHYVGDPTLRGRTFLEARAGQLESETTWGHPIDENFSQLLILEATGDKKLVRYAQPPRTWNFFRGKPQFTTKSLPADLDTTSVGLMVTRPEDAVVNSVMEEMLGYVEADGIPQTRPRIDPVVCANVLSLFYSRGRGSELPRALAWVQGTLEHRAYLEGTLYYQTAESFLFFVSRLLRSTDNEALRAQLAPLLKERLSERIGAHGTALALAMRIIACASVGVRDEVDLRELLQLQLEDGGWEASGIYRYPTSGIVVGNRGLTTAFALNAIATVEGP